MLIEFKVKNFKCLKDWQTLSMVASSDKSLRDQHAYQPNPQESTLLQTAAIYGPNGSGKSTVVDAIDTLQNLVLFSSKEQHIGEKFTEVVPFKLALDTLNAPTEFEIIFCYEGIKYQYGVSLLRDRILLEYLYAFPEGRPQLWFEREYKPVAQEETWYFGPKLKGAKKHIQDATQANALFLSTAAMLDHEQLGHPFAWFKHILNVLRSNNIGFRFSTDECRNSAMMKRIIEFMSHADLSIDRVEIKKVRPEHLNISPDFPKELKEQIIKDFREGDLDEPLFVHIIDELDTEVRFEIGELSLGTQKVFSLAGPILDVLDNGLVLVIDELHNNFHPFLTDYIMKLFRNATNTKHAQLIFTTHDTFMLNAEHLRRDQIWLTERNTDSLASKLFPLTDYHPRKNENFAKGYLEGRYGAIPYITQTMAD